MSVGLKRKGKLDWQLVTRVSAAGQSMDALGTIPLLLVWKLPEVKFF